MPMISDSNRFRFSKCFSLDAAMFLETETVENSDLNHPPKHLPRRPSHCLFS